MAKRVKPSVKLAELGLELPAVATPVAAYIPATRGQSKVIANYQIYTSGQLPMKDGELMGRGKVGEGENLVSPDWAYQCARQCALNAIAAAAEVAGGVDKLRYVVKVTGFVASNPGFTGQAAVINGASELLGEIFGEPGKGCPVGHARSAVGVAVLPLDAPVEVEIIFEARA